MKEYVELVKEYWEILVATTAGAWFFMKKVKAKLHDEPADFRRRLKHIEDNFVTHAELKSCERSVIDCINQQVHSSSAAVISKIEEMVRGVHERLDNHIDKQDR